MPQHADRTKELERLIRVRGLVRKRAVQAALTRPPTEVAPLPADVARAEPGLPILELTEEEASRAARAGPGDIFETIKQRHRLLEPYEGLLLARQPQAEEPQRELPRLRPDVLALAPRPEPEPLPELRASLPGELAIEEQVERALRERVPVLAPAAGIAALLGQEETARRVVDLSPRLPVTREQLIQAREALRPLAVVGAARGGAGLLGRLAPQLGPAATLPGGLAGAAALGITERGLTSPELIEMTLERGPRVGPFPLATIAGTTVALPAIFADARQVGRRLVGFAAAAEQTGAVTAAQARAIGNVGRFMLEGGMLPKRLPAGPNLPAQLARAFGQEALATLPFDVAMTVHDLAAGRTEVALLNIALSPTLGGVLGTTFRGLAQPTARQLAARRELRALMDERLRELGTRVETEEQQLAGARAQAQAVSTPPVPEEAAQRAAELPVETQAADRVAEERRRLKTQFEEAVRPHMAAGGLAEFATDDPNLVLVAWRPPEPEQHRQFRLTLFGPGGPRAHRDVASLDELTDLLANPEMGFPTARAELVPGRTQELLLQTPVVPPPAQPPEPSELPAPQAAPPQAPIPEDLAPWAEPLASVTEPSGRVWTVRARDLPDGSQEWQLLSRDPLSAEWQPVRVVHTPDEAQALIAELDERATRALSVVRTADEAVGPGREPAQTAAEIEALQEALTRIAEMPSPPPHLRLLADRYRDRLTELGAEQIERVQAERLDIHDVPPEPPQPPVERPPELGPETTEQVGQLLDELAVRPQPEAVPPAPDDATAIDQVFQAALEALEHEGKLPQTPGQFRDFINKALGEVEEEAAGPEAGRVVAAIAPDPGQAFDAAEAALHAHFLRRAQGFAEELRRRGLSDEQVYKALVQVAENAETALPRRVRTITQVTLQQFSTPLPLAEAMGRVAGFRPDDWVLEPTAGTGSLVQAAVRWGARSLEWAELDETRARLLPYVYPQARRLPLRDALELPLDPRLRNRYDVVIMNPPWRKGERHWTGQFETHDLAERFVHAAFRTLRPGGRLVALLPTTVLQPESQPFRQWLDQFWVRLVVQSPEEALSSRGTKVGSVLAVVDNAPRPENIPPVDWYTHTRAPLGWDEWTELTARPPERVEAPRERPERQPLPEPEPGAPGGVPAGPAAGPGTRPGAPGGLGGPGPARPPGLDLVGPGPGAGVPPGAEPPGPGAVVVAPGGGRDPGGAGPKVPRPLTRSAGVRIPPGTSAERAADIRAAARSEIFVPALQGLARGRPHGRVIVESRSLAGAPWPAIEYQPHPDIWRALDEGRISQEQAEGALRALQANAEGKGFLSGDAVGLGKSREAAAVIHEWLLTGQARQVLYVSKSRQHLEEFLREYRTAMNQDPPAEVIRVLDFPKARDDPSLLPRPERTLYLLDYFNFERYYESVAPRIDAIVWDEAHLFRNLDTKRGKAYLLTHASILARLGESAKFLYMTATPGSHIDHLEQFFGFREWTLSGFDRWKLIVKGEAHAQAATILDLARTEAELKQAVRDGDKERANRLLDVIRRRQASLRLNQSAVLAPQLEQIMRELKRKGLYMARDLWRSDLEFDTVPLHATPEDLEVYDRAAALAREITSQFWQFATGAQLKSRFGPRSFLQNYLKRLIYDRVRLPAAIRMAKDAVDEGHQVVISTIAVTGDKKEVGNAFIQAAINLIPYRRAITDRFGNVVEWIDIPEAVAVRAELMERARELELLKNPIDEIVAAFGRENVAIITGQVEAGERAAQIDEFNRGLRKVAIISQAGKEGINLHHTTETPGKARGRRLMVIADFEWGADKFLQEIGRVDRSGQITSPRINTLYVDEFPAERRFIGTLTKRLRAAGAIGKGAAEATHTDALDEFDILNDPWALGAVRDVYRSLPQNMRDEYFRGPKWRALLTDGPVTVKVSDFLLETVFMPVRVGNDIVDAFLRRRFELRQAASMEELMQLKTQRFRGRIVRSLDLSPELTLHEVQPNEGAKFAIVEGLVGPNMPAIQEARRAGRSIVQEPPRRFATFQTEEGLQISGLVLEGSDIAKVAARFGRGFEIARTPETALADILAGDRVPLVGAGNEVWLLRLRRDGRIMVDGAKFKQRDELLPAGATWDAERALWYIEPRQENVQKFLQHFPLRRMDEAMLAEGARTMRDAGTEQGRIAPSELGRTATEPHWQPPQTLSPRQRARLKTRRQIERILERAVEQQFGRGRMYRRPRRWLGYFNPWTEAIRRRFSGDVETSAHEVGHLIHKVLTNQELTPRKQLSARALLREMTKDVPPAQRHALAQTLRQELHTFAGHRAKGVRTIEGFAHFIEKYVVDPATAQTMGPHVFAWFEGRMAEQFPEMLGQLKHVTYELQLRESASVVDRAMTEVSWRPEPRKWSVPDFFHGVRAAVYNDLIPIVRFRNQVEKRVGPLRPSEDFALLAQIARGAPQKANHWLEYGTLYPDGRLRTPVSLKDVLGGLSEAEYREFALWALAQRDIRDLWPKVPSKKYQGPFAFASEKEAREVFAALDRPEFHERWRLYSRWRREWLEYHRAQGLLSPHEFTTFLNEHPHYVPQVREVMEERYGRAGYGGAIATPARFAKRMKGSGGLRTIDPWEAMIRQVYRTEALAARVRVIRALVRYAGVEGSGVFIEELKSPPKALVLQFERLLKELGIEPETYRKMISPDDPDSVVLPSHLIYWTTGDLFDKHGIIPFYDANAERWRWFEVKDPEFFRGLAEDDPAGLEGWAKSLGLFASLFRAGTVLDPTFPLRNVIKDQWSRAIYSAAPGLLGFLGPIPFAPRKFVRALVDYLAGTENYRQFLAGGAGGVTTFISLSRRSLRQSATTIRRSKTLGGRILNVITNPVEMAWLLADLGEHVTRLMELKDVREVYLKRGYTFEDALAGGAKQARDLMDFRFRGKSQLWRALAIMSAFWKPGILGYDKMVREMVKNPLRFYARTTFWVTLPTIGFYYLNRDDPEYWALPQWQRDMFWLIKVPWKVPLFGDNWVRVPKPFELGILFGAIPERILAWLQHNDPKRLDEALGETLGRHLISGILPIPTLLQPLIENWRNRTFFFGSTVEPEYLRRLPPEERFTERTSIVAHQLARWWNDVPGLPDLSPLQLENLITGYTSSVGRDVLRGLDLGVRRRLRAELPEIAPSPADIPIVGGFIARYPTGSNEPIQRFYEQWERTEQLYNAYRLELKRGRRNRAEALLDEHREEILSYRRLQKFADQLARYQEIARLVREQPTGLDPNERRQALDLIALERQDLAAEAIAWPHIARDDRARATRRAQLRALVRKLRQGRRREPAMVP